MEDQYLIIAALWQRISNVTLRTKEQWIPRTRTFFKNIHTQNTSRSKEEYEALMQEQHAKKTKSTDLPSLKTIREALNIQDNSLLRKEKKLPKQHLKKSKNNHEDSNLSKRTK